MLQSWAFSYKIDHALERNTFFVSPTFATLGYSLTEKSRKRALRAFAWISGWPSSALGSIPFTDMKIAFDQFHVAKYIGKAVAEGRYQEHKALLRVRHLPVVLH